MSAIKKPSPALFVFIVGALLLATIAGLLITGAANPFELVDPGAVVRWGLPIARSITDIAMATSIGAMVVAAFIFAEGSPELKVAMNIASVSAVIWTIAGMIEFNFVYLNITGTAFSTQQNFGSGLLLFATSVQLGQYLALNLIGAALIAILALAFQRLTSAALIAALGLLSIIPIALTGHAAGTTNHGMAVNALGLHLLAVVMWVGGLVAISLVRGQREVTQIHFSRYSTLALVAYVLLGVSGVVSAWLRIGNLANFLSAYGLLVILKTAAFVLLGILGAIYRKRLLLQGAKFARLVSVELVLMALAMGLATALSRTAPPLNAIDQVGTSPAEILTGEKLPPEFNALTFFSQWKPDLIWAFVSLGGILIYLLGVRRLRARGDSWPITRTLSWVAGMLFLFFITNGSLNAYQEYLFSAHMIGHMMLAMGVPIFLVPGAPVTLLSRAVEKRSDNSRGVREWVLWAVHTKYAQFVANPIVAAILFATSLVVFYYTPLFNWSTREHIGHEWMIVHFLITGYLFVQALIGVDPGPVRLSYPLRIMLLIGTLAFHAFFGLSLMSGDALLLPDWYGAMGRTWGAIPIEDQHVGGAIAWGIGELPTAALTIIVSVQWFKSDAREARRLDRASDRGGNKDIEDYNAMLSKLAKNDEKYR
jgi:cytochrome c oxidase assembly factor CtaG/putative copper export protein